jgi:hypothetical protein
MTARITAEECRREAQKCIDEAHVSLRASTYWLVLAELWIRMAEALMTENAVTRRPAYDARTWVHENGALMFGTIRRIGHDDGATEV